MMVLARLLVPKDLGLVGIVPAFIGFLALFKDAGLSVATVERALCHGGADFDAFQSQCGRRFPPDQIGASSSWASSRGLDSSRALLWVTIALGSGLPSSTRAGRE